MPDAAGDIESSEARGSTGGKGRAIACTAACRGSSRPFFISTRSNAARQRGVSLAASSCGLRKGSEGARDEIGGGVLWKSR